MSTPRAAPQERGRAAQGEEPAPATATASEPDGLRFMIRDASDTELRAAAAINHVDWMTRLALASGGTVAEEAGVTWSYVARAATEVTVAVTQPPAPPAREHLDRLLAMCRDKQVDRIGYWAFSQDYRQPLGAWLGARGFRPGGQPHWMALDLLAIPDLPPLPQLSQATGVRITERFAPRADSVLPCFHPDTARVRQEMTARQPRRVWHAVQWQDGEPTAQVSYCVTPGDLGICGLHDTVAVESARVAGIGLARAQWMFRFAADLGARYAITNAAAQTAGLYRMLGFRSLGFGQTWWLAGDALRVPAEPRTIALAEAIGLGDLGGLDRLAGRAASSSLDEQLANQMTPLQFAAAAGRPDSARWLIDHGAQPDVIAAWDLGWADEARQLLASRPGLVNQQRPRSGKSFLHVAVERDDNGLAELLLGAGIDVTITDHQFGATALEWARELKRVRLATTIKHRGSA
jgi:hypothetical protein